MGNMRFKVGDRVRVKSIDWYKETMDDYGRINYGFAQFIPDMSAYCGKILTICDIKEDFSYYHMKECIYVFMDEMIEELVEEEIIDIDDFQDDNEIIDVIDEYVHRLKNNECQINLPEGYQFTDENGNVINTTKIVLEKKKKEYPKTYDDFVSRVKRMREAQSDYEIIDMSYEYAKDHRCADRELVLQRAEAMTKAIKLENEVDEYLKKMEEEK